jgi:hypothetical protein
MKSPSEIAEELAPRLFPQSVLVARPDITLQVAADVPCGALVAVPLPDPGETVVVPLKPKIRERQSLDTAPQEADGHGVLAGRIREHAGRERVREVE